MVKQPVEYGYGTLVCRKTHQKSTEAAVLQETESGQHVSEVEALAHIGNNGEETTLHDHGVWNALIAKKVTNINILFESSELHGNALAEQEDDEGNSMWLPCESKLSQMWPSFSNESTSLDFETKMKISSQLSETQVAALLAVCKKSTAAFPTEHDRLGHCTVRKHKIETADAEPIKQRLRRVSPANIEVINTSVQDMLRMGVITPCDSG